MALEEVSSVKMYDGFQKVFSHESQETKTKMNFGIYLPKQIEEGPCPVVYYLSGLTCTEQNFVTKANAQKYASEYGIVVVAPDTSPRGAGVEGEEESWDFGTGAGFYVDATAAPWATNYRMYSYVTKELPAIVKINFKVNEHASIMGHSMGGHGALICFLKNPGMYQSVSAFAPICNPVNCPWGQKAFAGYLGPDQEAWRDYDASEILKKNKITVKSRILCDQGTDDGFLPKGQLLPGNFVDACAAAGVPLDMRMQSGYDHSYYFIATFMEDHMKHHAKALNRA